MTLPKIKHPLYKQKIPSTGKKIMFRPFTVKEEKLILMAQQSDKIDDAVGAIKQILQNCIVKPGDFDVDKLTTFDIEFLFIQLRAKSVSETVDLVYTERFDDDGETDDVKKPIKYKATVNLDDVKVKFVEGHTDTIMLSDEVGVKMVYPSFDQLAGITEADNEQQQFDLMLSCISVVFDSDNVYSATSDFTREELNDFIEQLSLKPIKLIGQFFVDMPSVQHEVTFVSGDGLEKVITLKGINDFFT